MEKLYIDSLNFPYMEATIIKNLYEMDKFISKNIFD
jgi:hypothetical protein